MSSAGLRLKKAAKFATGTGSTHTQTLFRNAVATAKTAGQEVKVDIDSFNKVATAKADAMKAADTTRYSEVPANVKEDVLNTLIDDDAMTPEEVAAEISQELTKFFEGSMKIKVDGQWKQIKFSTNRGSQTRLEGDTQNEFLGMFQRACAQYIFDNINAVQDEN